jgi:hypothetical protein
VMARSLNINIVLAGTAITPDALGSTFAAPVLTAVHSLRPRCLRVLSSRSSHTLVCSWATCIAPVLTDVTGVNGHGATCIDQYRYKVLRRGDNVDTATARVSTASPHSGKHLHDCLCACLR